MIYNKFILLSFLLLFGCGKDVSVSNAKLQKFSNITETDLNKDNQDGKIVRGSTDQIIFASRTYKVSVYSSYSALEFIAARPLNSQVSVTFRGSVKDGDMVLEYVAEK